jgi:hypothetical protein
VNAAAAVEADDAVTTGQQHQECAGSLTSKEKHPLRPARNWNVADNRRPARRGLSKREGKRRNGSKHERERQSRSPK